MYLDETWKTLTQWNACLNSIPNMNDSILFDSIRFYLIRFRMSFPMWNVWEKIWKHDAKILHCMTTSFMDAPMYQCTVPIYCEL